jgi:hypothetical protein
MPACPQTQPCELPHHHPHPHHLLQGVWEKDEDRKHDSFRTFEEVLQLARSQVCVRVRCVRRRRRCLSLHRAER